MSELEKATLFSSERCNVNVRLTHSDEVHYFVTAVLDTGGDPNLVSQEVIPSPLTPLSRPTKICLSFAGDTTLKMSCVFRLPIDVRGELVNVVFEVAPILGTWKILSTAIIDMSFKSI